MGGPCGVGIESTVVDMTGPLPRILRPGMITEDMISQVIGEMDTDDVPTSDAPRSPGMKYKHYAPKAKMTLFCGSPALTAQSIMALDNPDVGVLCFEEYVGDFKGQTLSLGESWDSECHAKRLFDALRELDELDLSEIYAQCPRPIGGGAAVANRMYRACSHNIINCGDKIVIGVTGRSGSGKSLFAKQAEALGALTLDADEIYQELLNTSAPLKSAIFQRFPQAESNGTVDKRALGAIVFNDEKARLELNAITHHMCSKKLKTIYL